MKTSTAVLSAAFVAGVIYYVASPTKISWPKPTATYSEKKSEEGNVFQFKVVTPAPEPTYARPCESLSEVEWKAAAPRCKTPTGFFEKLFAKKPTPTPVSTP